VITLDKLHQGAKARIVKLIDDNIRSKLLQMGCVPGTIIIKEFSAPLGDPLAFSINGYLLSMSSELAKSIQIETIQ